MKKKLFVILRVSISIGLLLFISRRIGLDQMKLVLSSVKPSCLAVLYGLQSLDLVLRCQNLRLLLQIKNYHLPLRTIVYVFLVGNFFGTLIPSSLGTEMTRGFILSQRAGVRVSDSALSLLVLNLMSLLSLCGFGLISALLLGYIGGERTVAWVIMAICASYTILFPFLMRGWVPHKKLLELGKLGKVFLGVRKFSVALRSFADCGTTLTKVFGVCLLNQLMAVFIVYSSALSLNLDVRFVLFMIYVPIITLSRLIPFSIGGFGAEQGIFVLLFGQADVPAAEAFIISIVVSVSVLSFSILGGVIYGFDSLYRFVTRELNSEEKKSKG